MKMSVDYLSFNENEVSSLANVFQVLTTVTEVDLCNNKITSVNTDDFKYNPRLRSLNLSNNNISHLSDDAFKNVPNLDVLNLANNQITSLNSAIFQSLHKLQELHLNENNLAILPEDIFEGLNETKEMDLSGNDLQQIPVDIFSKLLHLEKLNVTNNFIINIINNSIITINNSLRTLDVSNNMLEVFPYLQSSSLQILDLSGNRLQRFKRDHFSSLPNLTELNLNRNAITFIDTPVFSHLGSLQILRMTNLPNLTYLGPQSFEGLNSLEQLYLSHNPKLSFVHRDLFAVLHSISIIDLSFTAISQLYKSTVSTNVHLSSLYLQGNVLVCDCAIDWIVKNMNSNESLFNQQSLECVSKTSGERSLLATVDTSTLPCSSVDIANFSGDSTFRIGQSAVIKCQALSDPSPEITWITPRNKILYYQMFPDMEKVMKYQYDYDINLYNLQWEEKPSYTSVHESQPGRMSVLPDGSLYIDYVMRTDAGQFRCIARNPRNSTEVTVNVILDYAVIKDVVYVWSLIVGFSCAGAFFLLNLTYSLTLAGIRRCISQRRRERIKHMIETMDTYKSNQLARIKENYTSQVGRIRDQYHYQLGRLREHHQSQVERMGRMREGASQRVDKLKENYNNQLSRLKEYSSSQLEQLREKYNSQVDKIKDFGHDKMDRIHEKYKLKQQHVIKLFEMMNLDNCRTVLDSECTRAESMILQSEGFPEDLPLHSPLDSLSISDSEYMTATSSESSQYSSRQNVHTEGAEHMSLNEADRLSFETPSEDPHLFINAEDGMAFYEVEAETPSTSQQHVKLRRKKRRHNRGDQVTQEEGVTLCSMEIPHEPTAEDDPPDSTQPEPQQTPDLVHNDDTLTLTDSLEDLSLGVKESVV